MVSSLFVAPTVGASVNWAAHTVTVSSSVLNALDIELSNKVNNPSFEISTSGWSPPPTNSISQSSYTSSDGNYSAKCTYQNNSTAAIYNIILPSPGSYYASIDIWIPSDYDGQNVRLELFGFTPTSAFNPYADMTKRDQWQTITGYINVNTDLNGYITVIYKTSNPSIGKYIYIDNVILNHTVFENPPSYYAVTDLYHIGSIYMVSLAGLSSSADPDNWTITDALWLGTAAVADDYSTAAIEGTAAYDAMTQGVVYDDWGGDDSTPLFPWESGRMAYFGTRAVHDAGYGLDGWQAVDWVSGPSYGTNFYQNGIYASEDAQITYVCRDDTSVAVRAGNFLYAHLADNSTLQQGYKLRKGVKFAELVPGSFNDKCGWAAQQPDSYHIHWGFYASGGKLVIEDWTLDTASSTWSRGNQTVHVGDAMLSTGTSYPENGEEENGDYEAALDGSHFWDSPINSIITFVTKKIIPRFPEGQSREIGKTYMNSAGVAIRIFFVLLKSNFNLGIFVFVFLFISFIEPIRLLYAGYKLIKDAIPGA